MASGAPQTEQRSGLAGVARKLEDFVRSNPNFQAAVDASFAEADRDASSSISLPEAYTLTRMVWDKIEPKLREIGVEVDPPSDDLVRNAFDSTAQGRRTLDRASFEDFFLVLVKKMAKALAVGAVQTYGIGMLTGLVALHFSKAAVRATPIAGSVARPFLSLIPTLIVGPVLGVLAVWGQKRGDIFAAFKLLLRKD